MFGKLQFLLVCVAAFCLLVEAKPQYGYAPQTVTRKESVSYTPTGQRTTYTEENVASPYGGGSRRTVSQQSSSGYHLKRYYSRKRAENDPKQHKTLNKKVSRLNFKIRASRCIESSLRLPVCQISWL
ncbi:hypothetical protein AVEN_225733-1 [Araneus ventricosus]|uniref:Secreted protein n=1 Tax=Araneus ventricosus TaxID=182803 RepID=A0A4Y2RFW9_ARAVE|nr:hypothetical protein AVEN_225733-1 [Araneus ventricosus]